jgi:methyl-accepting chemotaxis protein
MKISHRLIALAAFSSAGLVCVGGVSYFAVTSIQSDLRGLTLQATPLQNKTYEVQERTERLLGSLLKLTLARDRAEVDRASTVIQDNMQRVDTLHAEIQALDPHASNDFSEFRSAQSEINQAVQKRLSDEVAYRAETDNARTALGKAQEAIAVTRSNVNQIGIETGKAADRAQEAVRRLSSSMKQALSAQSQLKEIAILVNETDAVSNRFKLSPLKEKLKSTVDSITRLEPEAGSDDVLKDSKALVASVQEGFTNEGTGLLALRAAVLAAKPEADAAYQKQRKAILAPLDEQSRKLSAMTDALEVQAFKQRQNLEAALRLRNEPGGVVSVSEDVSLDIREMVGTIRLLMLATTEGEATAAQEGMDELGKQLSDNMGQMRSGLIKMGRPQLTQHVDSALQAMTSVMQSVAKVAQAKKSLIASEARMADSLAQLKTVAAKQASVGEAQVKSITQRQSDITAAVDRRVESSLFFILAISGAIIAGLVALSLRTIRVVTRRLDQAVRVAEAVSQGRLDQVQVVAGNDETTRLLTALGSMVQTLTGIVQQIRAASESINQGSIDITQGNSDLSGRTVTQAHSLQATATAVEQLSGTVKQNTESARQATALAQSASDVAGRGGAVVGDVVHTMSQIQESSRQIAEITGVIDAIAFQTNILALNAAVEAARAGQHGRGFAVVAGEVRALAKKSAEAASRIKTIVGASVNSIDAGSKLVQNAGQTMGDIVQQVSQVSHLIGAIAQASEDQWQSVQQVGSAVSSLDEMTQRNAALAQQGTAAALSLSGQAQDLATAISVFKA